MLLRPQLSLPWQWWAQLVTEHLMDVLGVQLQPSLVQFLLIEGSSLIKIDTGTWPVSILSCRGKTMRDLPGHSSPTGRKGIFSSRAYCSAKEPGTP